jgi:hypothetical protein
MPPARKREPIVPAKVREAFEHMLATPGATLQSAAALVGMPTFKLRYAMNQPHCLRYMLAEKQARLEAASAGNISSVADELVLLKEGRMPPIRSPAPGRSLGGGKRGHMPDRGWCPRQTQNGPAIHAVHLT